MEERRSTELFKINKEQATAPLIPDVKPEVRYRSFQKSFGSGLLVALSGVFIGFSLSQASPIDPTIYAQAWGVTFSLEACQIIMIGIPTVAAIIGAVMSNFILVHLSRKMSLFAAAICVIISSIIMTIPTQETLIIGRVLEGVSVGWAMGITSIYLREISPKELRSVIMPLIAVGITLGSVLTYMISQIMQSAGYPPVGQARVLLLFNCAYAIIQIIGIFTVVPHSPHERIGKGFEEQGRAILALMYKDKYVEEELFDIKKDLASAKKSKQAADISESQRDPEQLKLVQKAEKARGVAVFVSIYRQLNGGLIILTFCGPIIQVIQGDNTNLVSITPLIATILAFVGNVIGVFTVSKYLGRKTLLMIAAIGMFCTNVILAVMLQTNHVWVFFAFTLIQMIFYGLFSLAPGWTYPNQVVAPDKVALQNGMQTVALVIAVFLNPIVYIYTPGNLAYGVFYVGAAINFVGIFVYSFVLVESKGLTYHEIIERY